MKIIASCLLALTLLLPHRLGANSIDFLALAFASNRPTVSDALVDAVPDPSWIAKAVAHNRQLMRRVPQIKYRVSGSTDGLECAATECHELAMRRACLFQEALVAAGAPTTMFCPLNAVITPWPFTHPPSVDDMEIGRRATFEPVFERCT